MTQEERAREVLAGVVIGIGCLRAAFEGLPPDQPLTRDYVLAAIDHVEEEARGLCVQSSSE